MNADFGNLFLTQDKLVLSSGVFNGNKAALSNKWLKPNMKCFTCHSHVKNTFKCVSLLLSPQLAMRVIRLDEKLSQVYWGSKL